ncbi:MAG: hypothetical protein VB068_15075 [Petrimonas sp.]|nr:hypothetical protein [Petrimonas sp.]
MLDIDCIAYQDEIGVEKIKVEESAEYFERLCHLHKKASRLAFAGHPDSLILYKELAKQRVINNK